MKQAVSEGRVDTDLPAIAGRVPQPQGLSAIIGTLWQTATRFHTLLLYLVMKVINSAFQWKNEITTLARQIRLDLRPRIIRASISQTLLPAD